MKNQTRTIRNLCIFILIALSCGWVGVWVDSLTGETTGDFSDTSNGTSGMGIFIFAPMLTWLLLRALMAMAGAMQDCVRLSRKTSVGMVWLLLFILW